MVGGSDAVQSENAAFQSEIAGLYDEARRVAAAREAVLVIGTHDLRAPLSAVVAGASLLTSLDASNPDGDRGSPAVHAAAEA